MNDYKELIEMLRNYPQDLLAYKLGCAFADAVDSAADVIEQLVNDRNASVDALKAIEDAFCSYGERKGCDE